jgi:hypothetical protein
MQAKPIPGYVVAETTESDLSARISALATKFLFPPHWVKIAEDSAVEIGFDSYAAASLPANPITGQIGWVTDNIRGPWIYNGTVWRSMSGRANVMDFGASGSATTTTTTGTNGAGTTINLTSSSTFLSGHGIFIEGAGAAGVDYVGTVSSVPNGTSVVVTPATSTSIAAGADVTHDDTAAVQTAINAVDALGGGTIYFPEGFYRFNRKLDTTENSILTIPRVAAGAVQKTFVFEGSWVSYTDSDSEPTFGTIWSTTRVAGSGTVPSLICARAFSVTSTVSNFSHIMPIVLKIYVQTATNPSISVFNWYNSVNMLMKHVQITTGVTLGSVVEPTNSGVHAILTPGINNSAQLGLQWVSIRGGFYNGVLANENLVCEALAITRCKVAVHCGDMNLAMCGTLLVSHCPIVFNCDNAAQFYVNMRFERDTGSDWFSAGAGSTVEITKAGGTLRGFISYQLNIVGSGPNTGRLTHNLGATDLTLVLHRQNAGAHINMAPLIIGAPSPQLTFQDEDGNDANSIHNITNSGAFDFHFYANADWTGSVVNRRDTGKGTVDLFLSPNGRSFAIQQAASGANPVTYTNIISGDHDDVTVTPALNATTSIAVAAGTAITKIVVYTPSLTPASVAASTSAEQDFTVTGLTTADKVILNGPAPTAGTGIVNVRVKSADTLSITWGNFTTGSLTPASGTYNVVAIRS